MPRLSTRSGGARRLCLAGAIGAIGLACTPLHAQAPRPSQSPLPSTPAATASAPDPFGDMPDIGVDWPDLGADETGAAVSPPDDGPPTDSAATPRSGIDLPPLAGTGAEDGGDAAALAADRLAAIDPARPIRYDTRLTGIEAAADTLLRTRFDTLSELLKGEGDEANIAQITRRARADSDMVEELLRTRGYYDARTSYQLIAPDRGAQKLVVEIEGRPGDRYRLGSVAVRGLAQDDVREARLRALFTVKPGDPADTDAILASADALRTGLLDGGYPFAKVGEPELRIDHDDRGAALDLIVAAGGYRRYGRIVVTGDPPFDARHVGVIARFAPDDPYRQSEIQDLERALVQTGLVGSVDVTTRPGETPDSVDLDIALTRAPARTVAGELGYGTGEGARAEISWQHRNLFPPEGGLTLRGVLGTQEQGAAVVFRRNNVGRRDRAVNAQLAASNLNRPAYRARSVSLAGSFERQTNIIFQKRWTWSFGGELVLTDERDLYGTNDTPRRRTFFIAAAPVSLAYDGSDDLLDPTRGFRLSGRLSPELSLQNTTFGYVRAQVDASGYVPLGARVTLAGRVRVGSIVGAGADRIAPTRRFYAGGGGSVRGYGFQAIGPRDLDNDPVGGRSLGEVAVEARYRFGSSNQFGLVPFVDAGTIASDPLPSVRNFRIGAGLGFRYYSNFGPIRIDVGTPINPQPGDSRIGVYVSLGQAF